MVAKNIAVFGDIAIEIRSSIPLPFNNLLEHSIIDSKIELSVGGGGWYFSKYASLQSHNCILFSKYGNDYFSNIISSELSQYNIIIPLAMSKLNTSIFIICYDNGGHGTRLILKNSPNSSTDLSINDIINNDAIIKSSDIVYVSGYYLFYGSPRCDATQIAINLASSNGKHIMIDLVPHDIYISISLQSLFNMFGISNAWISEVPTIRRLLKLGHPQEIINRDIVIETVAELKKIGGIWLLRFGKNNYEHQVLVSPHREEWIDTGYIHGRTDPKGFGEKLSLEAINILLEKEWK